MRRCVDRSGRRSLSIHRIRDLREYVKELDRQIRKDQGGFTMEPYSTYAYFVWMFAAIGVIASIITACSLVKEFFQWLKSLKPQ